MESGDLVKVTSNPSIDGSGQLKDYHLFWREATHLLGFADFQVDCGTVMMLFTTPWDVFLNYSDGGKQVEIHVRVIHPEFGIIRGYANWITEIEKT